MVFFTETTEVIAFQNRSIKSNPNLWGSIFFKRKDYLAPKANCRSPFKQNQREKNIEDDKKKGMGDNGEKGYMKLYEYMN